MPLASIFIENNSNKKRSSPLKINRFNVENSGNSNDFTSEIKLGQKRKADSSSSFVNEMMRKMYKGIKRLAINTAKSITSKSRRNTTIQNNKPQIELDLNRTFEEYVKQAESGKNLVHIDKSFEKVLTQFNQHYGYETKLEKPQVQINPLENVSIILEASNRKSIIDSKKPETDLEITSIIIPCQIDEKDNLNKVYLSNNPLKTSSLLDSIVDNYSQEGEILKEEEIEKESDNKVDSLDQNFYSKNINHRNGEADNENAIQKSYHSLYEIQSILKSNIEASDNEDDWHLELLFKEQDTHDFIDSITVIPDFADNGDHCNIIDEYIETSIEQNLLDDIDFSKIEISRNIFDKGEMESNNLNHLSRVAQIVDLFENGNPVKPGEDLILDL